MAVGCMVVSLIIPNPKPTSQPKTAFNVFCLFFAFSFFALCVFFSFRFGGPPGGSAANAGLKIWGSSIQSQGILDLS